VTNIHKLGYDYDDFAKQLSETQAPNNAPTPHIRVSGVSRADAKGSFLMSVWTGDNADGTQTLVGLEPVLSRWHVSGCANCSTHLNVATVIPLREISMKNAENTQFEVLVHTRNRRFGGPSLGGKTPSLRVGQMFK
jgi:tyrosinase